MVEGSPSWSAHGVHAAILFRVNDQGKNVVKAFFGLRRLTG
jgi:hypothetical protein